MANVALVAHSPLLSGAERMLVNLAIGLDRSTVHHPTVLLPEASAGPVPSLLERAGIEWREVPATRWYIFEDSARAPEFSRYVLKAAEAYADLYWRTNTDIVIVNTLTNLEAPLGARLAGLPYILWAHGILDSGQIRRFEHVKRFADGITLNLAHRIVCCSSWTERHYRLLARPEIVGTITNWTDVSKAPVPKTAQASRFCVLATLERHKGIDTVIQAIRRLRDRGMDVGVDVYGDGPLSTPLQHLSRDLGVADLIAFHGRTDNADAVYANAFATIVPSQIEPFGLVAIESMAAGTPVIAARTGGLFDIVEDQVSGLHFTPGDADALARKIRFMMETPAAAQAFALAGRQRAIDQYDGTKSLRKFDALLKETEAQFQGYGKSESFELNALRLLAVVQSETSRTDIAPVVSSDAERELEAIRASTYWRMGAPLRKFLSDSPRLRRRLRSAAQLARRALTGRISR
jgi:glycosyltransferase involved in cell wall biosynthesis